MTLSSVSGLGELIPTVEGKLLVSGLALLMAVLTTWFARRAQSRLKDHVRPATADVFTTIVVVTVFVGAVAVIIDTWALSNNVAEELTRADRGQVIARLAVTGIVLVGAQVVAGVIRRLFDDLMGSSDAVTEHQREVTYRLSQLLIWAIALITVLGVWEINLGGLLIGAGFLGIVVGMAARQTLSALLAGFVLMFSRPFEIGDWVEVGEESQEGIVTDITMMNTRIQTFDGEYVMVPNDVISGQAITNRSRKGRLRVEIEVGVDYEDDVERATELAEEALDDVEDALSVPTPQVVLKEFGGSSVVLGVRFWIDNPSARRTTRARTEAIQAIKEVFDAEGISIPYPNRTLGVRGAGGDLSLTKGSESEQSATDQSEGDRSATEHPPSTGGDE